MSPKYRDLNAPPDKKMADIVRSLRQKAESSKTGAHGVKDMGSSGDSVWRRPDGTEHSVREVDAELEGAKDRIEGAVADLTETQERQDAAEKTVEAVQGDIIRVETEVIPSKVQKLEQADTVVSDALAELDAELYGAGGTIDTLTDQAQTAHNEAVEAAAQIEAKIMAGSSVILNGGFEQADSDASSGALGWDLSSIMVGQVWRHTPPAGGRSGGALLRFEPRNSSVYPRSLGVSDSATRTFYMRGWFARYANTPDGTQPSVGFYVQHEYHDGTTSGEIIGHGDHLAGTLYGQWVLVEAEATVPEGVARTRFAPRVVQHATAIVYFDDMLVVDVTEARAAQTAAEAAQATASAAAEDLATAFPAGAFDVDAELAQTIYRSVVEYAVSASDSVAPTSGWSDAAPTRVPGEFIWFRTVVTYGDGVEGVSSAALMTGNDGAKGEPGIPGVPGEDGTSVTILGTLGSEADLPSSGTPGDGYLIDGYLHVWTGSTWENVGLIQGPQGAPGAPGDDGQTTYVWVKYADTSTGLGMSDDPAGKRYIGLAYNKLTQTESGTASDYTWALFEGPPGQDGDPGADGVGISSVTPYFLSMARGSTAPQRPTTAEPTGWSTTEPAWDIGRELYRTERIIYSSGQFAYTEVTLVASYQGIDVAITSANGKNTIVTSALPASDSQPGKAEGDTWFMTDANDHIAGQWTWTGTTWKPTMVGNGVLASMDLHKVNITGSGAAEEFTVNTLWSEWLAAKTLIAQSLSIAPGNMLIDGLGKTTAGQAAYGNGGFAWEEDEKAWVNRSSAPGNAQMFLNPPGTANYTAYTIEPGREYRFSYDIRVDGGTTRTRAAIRMTRKDGTTTFVGDGIGDGDTAHYEDIPAGQWVHVERTWRAPADAALASFEAQYVQSSSTAHTYMSRNLFVGPKASAVLIENGAVTAPKIHFTEELSGGVARFMSTESKKLVVTEEAILNHATLIGQTVVDDINVQGKLIGTDGVFTGTVDFANINVTDRVLAERISGEYLYGTEIEGGRIYTTDSGAGQVTLSDDGFIDSSSLGTYPGIRVAPPDMSDLVSPPGIGPNENGFIITGGRNVSGGRGYSIYSPRKAEVRFVKGAGDANVAVSDGMAYLTTNDGTGNSGEILTTRNSASLQSIAADGSRGYIHATTDQAVVATTDPGGNFMSQIRSNGREAYLWSVAAGGEERILSVDTDGVWVKSNESGVWKHINLLGSEWTTLSLRNGWSAYTAGGGFYPGARVRLTPTGVQIQAMVKGGSSGSTVAILPAGMQPPYASTFPGQVPGGTAQCSVSLDGSTMALRYNDGPNAPGFVSLDVTIPL